MKKFIYNAIYAICLTGSVTSCADFLEIDPQNEIVLEQFWNEKADVEAVMLGCYSRMAQGDIVERMMIWGEYRSDNIIAGLNADQNLNLTNLLKENLTASNGYASWSGFYEVINRCNTVIKYAPEVAAKDPGYTDSEKRATIAEASALRDLCYFYLIRTFRDVPVSFEAFTSDDQEMALPARPFNEVLNLLIADLEKVKNDAVKYYPVTTPLYQTARITQDAINAMLCEMYLWKKDYAQCVKYADLVIASKKEQLLKFNSSMTETDERTDGYPLLPEYYSRTTSNKYYGNAYSRLFSVGNTQESIFELTYSGKENESTSYLSNGAVNYHYGNSVVNCGVVSPSSVVMGESSTLFNTEFDVRYYENFNTKTSSIAKFVHRTLTVEKTATAGSTPSPTWGLKWTDGRNKANWIVYRLTDIMLLKAEALVQMMVEGDDVPEPQTAPGCYLVKLNNGSLQFSTNDKADQNIYKDNKLVADTANAMTVERALVLVNTLGTLKSTAKKQLFAGYVTGTVTVSEDYKATFKLVNKEGTDTLLVVGAHGLGDKDIKAAINTPKEGDYVMMYGKLMKGVKLDEAALAANEQYIKEAFSLVNAINKRSVMSMTLNADNSLVETNYQSKPILEKLVMDERQRELMFEGKRYYDLVRAAMREGKSTEMATIISKKFMSGAEAVRVRLSRMDGIFWPYFIDELKVNPNLHQNPAFGSGENGSYTKN